MTDKTPDMFVAVDADGRAASKRAHLFEECSFLSGDKTKKLTVGESALLGLRVCVVCEKRRTGGPAIDILEGFFGEDSQGEQEPREAAWMLSSYLREHGWYLAHRTKKDAE